MSEELTQTTQPEVGLNISCESLTFASSQTGRSRARCAFGKRPRHEQHALRSKDVGSIKGLGEVTEAPSAGSAHTTEVDGCGHSSDASASPTCSDFDADDIDSDNEAPPIRQPFRFARDRTLDDLSVAAGVLLLADELGPAWSRAPQIVLEAAQALASLTDGDSPTPLHRQKHTDDALEMPEVDASRSVSVCFDTERGAGDADDIAQSQTFLLPPPLEAHIDRHTLVLDLDETLVHSSHSLALGTSGEVTDRYCDWNPHLGDFYCEAEDDDGTIVPVYVRVRPGAIEFLRAMCQLYEVVLFTAGTAKYAASVIAMLDPDVHYFHHILTREHCSYYMLSADGTVREVPSEGKSSATFHNINTNATGEYVKDLSRLGRPIDRIVIVDNNPKCYMLHPRNAIGCTTWHSDREDNELEHFGSFLDAVSLAPEVFSDLDEFHHQLEQMSGNTI